MEKSFDAMVSSFKEFVKRIKQYEEALAVIYWDLRTGAPKKGVPGRAEVIGMLSTEVFRMSTSTEMEEYLGYFTKEENSKLLDNIMKALVKEYKKDFDRFKKIPEEVYKEYVILTSEAESVWEEAKNNNDFDLFSPYLEKIVSFNLKFIEYWGCKSNKYDTLLDYYEPGMTVEKLDKIFKELREKIVPLVSKIKVSEHQPDDSIFKKDFCIKKQDDFSRYILEKMGYDFEAGRLDESEHPFTIGMTPGDVRITTHYYKNLFSSALFSAVHEGGHALYEQNISADLNGTALCTGTSMGVHESQSRLWENMIGRSYEFWKCYYPELLKVFPEQFEGVSLDEFYRAINKVESSLIRVEADELTYNLHIMIRYEIEKALINQEIKVADLPRIWNERMEEYLGVVPTNDAEGVLQDVHWSGGSFGYFPSYTLGNIYSAQLLNAIKRDIPDLSERLSNGDMLVIKEWLADKVHKHGKLLTPAEILKSVTGEEIEPKHLVQYLEDKYTQIYKL